MKYNHYILSLFLLTDIGLAAINCTNPKEECIEAGDTREVDGASITLPCWRYQVTYECKADVANDCDELRKQGCYQYTANCKATWNDACAVQEEIFKCPAKACKEIAEEVCTENIECIDGGCIPTTATKNQNIGKAASNLAVLNAAASEFAKNNEGQTDVKNPFIFTGTPMACSKNLINFKNCCGVTGRGWGMGWLASCDKGEQALAKTRGEKKAIYVGEYCHTRVPLTKACSSRHYVYCVYGSKLARIIREAGVAQGIKNLGTVAKDGSGVHCLGLTPEELSKVNFDSIDFSDLMDELNEKNPENDPAVRFNAAKNKLDYESVKNKSVAEKLSVPEQASGRIKDFYDRSKK